MAKSAGVDSGIHGKRDVLSMPPEPQNNDLSRSTKTKKEKEIKNIKYKNNKLTYAGKVAFVSSLAS